MSRERLTQFIYQSNLVSLKTSKAIAECFEQRLIAKNDFLLKSGFVSDCYFYLDQGFLRAFAEDTAGAEVTTNFYLPGQMVFEVSSFFNHARSKENIQALTNCEGWFITLRQLNELFHSMPEFREFGRLMLIKGFSELKSRMLSTITETAEERYLHLITGHPELFQHASLKHIATYLGITDTSLSRIRAAILKK